MALPDWLASALGAPQQPRPYPKNPLDPADPNYDPVLDPHSSQYNPNDPRFVGGHTPNGIYYSGGVSPYVAKYGPPISGPQQSYASASGIPANNPLPGIVPGSNGPGVPANNPLPGIVGDSGQAGQQESSYNSAPYNPTGAPQANSQAELVGQGGRGLAQYQSTPTWTGSVNSQAPPARSEGDFIAPPISGPMQFHYWQPNQNPKFAQYLAALRLRRG